MQYRNTPKARIEGIEFEGRYDAGPWYLGLTAQSMEGRDLVEGDPLRSVPSDKLTTLVGLRLFDRKLTLQASWTGARYDHIPAGYTYTASYNLVDVYVGYQPTPDVLVHAAINNLLDEYYLPYPGRADRHDPVHRRAGHHLQGRPQDQVRGLSDARPRQDSPDGPVSRHVPRHEPEARSRDRAASVEQGRPARNLRLAAPASLPPPAPLKRACRRRHPLGTAGRVLCPSSHTATGRGSGRSNGVTAMPVPAELSRRLAANPGLVIEQAAQQFDVTERDVVEALPALMRRLAPGAAFIDAMADIATWGEVTFIIHTADGVFEISGAVPPGEVSHGYFNLMSRAGLHGHLRHDRCAAIGFVERPFMGMPSAAVMFFNIDGGIMFKVFVGRDEARALKADQVEAFRALADRLAGAAEAAA